MANAQIVGYLRCLKSYTSIASVVGRSFAECLAGSTVQLIMHQAGVDDRPREVWARSLRRDTDVQDQLRRAIHAEHASVANGGFERYDIPYTLR